MVIGYQFLLNTVFLTVLMGAYKSHPGHQSLLLLYPTFWPRKSVVDTIDFSVRFMQHLFYLWQPPRRSHKNSVPTSLCQRKIALYKRCLSWGAGTKCESHLEWFTEVTGFIKTHKSFGDQTTEGTNTSPIGVLLLEITIIIT